MSHSGAPRFGWYISVLSSDLLFWIKHKSSGYLMVFTVSVAEMCNPCVSSFLFLYHSLRTAGRILGFPVDVFFTISCGIRGCVGSLGWRSLVRMYTYFFICYQLKNRFILILYTKLEAPHPCEQRKTVVSWHCVLGYPPLYFASLVHECFMS